MSVSNVKRSSTCASHVSVSHIERATIMLASAIPGWPVTSALFIQPNHHSPNFIEAPLFSSSAGERLDLHLLSARTQSVNHPPSQVPTPSAVTRLALSRCLSRALSWAWLLRQGNSLRSLTHTYTHTPAAVANWMAGAEGPGLYVHGEEPWISVFHLNAALVKRWVSVGNDSSRVWIFTFLWAAGGSGTCYVQGKKRRQIWDFLESTGNYHIS